MTITVINYLNLLSELNWFMLSQAAWEKLFRYFDVEPKIVKPNLIDDRMAINAQELVAQVDEKTIAVV